jgi:hypothetical protein
MIFGIVLSTTRPPQDQCGNFLISLLQSPSRREPVDAPPEYKRYWHSFRTLGWETLLILKTGKYGKKFSASFGKFLGPMRVSRIKGDGLQSPEEKMRGVWSTSWVLGWKGRIDEIAIEAKTVQQNFI